MFPLAALKCKIKLSLAAKVKENACVSIFLVNNVALVLAPMMDSYARQRKPVVETNVVLQEVFATTVNNVKNLPLLLRTI